MRIVNDFPHCQSLQFQLWRYATYQFVHAGVAHIGFNLLLQIIFGLPLNMVRD
jgi:rhomboid-related protein 1/2/3